MSTVLSSDDIKRRLTSLDFMRGFIMCLLALESTGLYDTLYESSIGGPLENIFIQFQHHPWNGLRFWDLIQPGFMFIAGTAMAFSLQSQANKGIAKSATTVKMLKRSGWLFFWGVLLYAVRKTGLSFELWNVLTQLSFTLLISYLIYEWATKYHIIFCVGLLLLTELLYRFTHVSGFDQPFTNQQNFGNYIDMLLMHKTSKGGWVAINCIPTAVHTIAGALVGKWIMGEHTKKEKLIFLIGAVLIVVGYTMDFTHITPIIKRIATSSFTIVSLGWCMVFFAICYYVMDVKKGRELLFFKVLSMNSIFIYLLFETVGTKWLNGYMTQLVSGLLQLISFPTTATSILCSLSIFAVEWGICLFLYRKKIFFRL